MPPPPLPQKPPATRFTAGLHLPFEAASFLWRAEDIRRFALLPLLASAVLYVCLIAGSLYAVAHFHLRVDLDFVPHVGTWLTAAVNAAADELKWVLAIPVILAGTYVTFTTAGMVIAAPFNDLLAARVEARICAQEQGESINLRHSTGRFVLVILDAAWIVARQLFWSILALPLLLVPVVGWVPLFVITAHFTGLGFLDVSAAGHGLRSAHKRPMWKRLQWELFGLGVAMELLFLIPFAGLLLLPIGVVAGTMMYCRSPWNEVLAAAGVKPPKAYRPPRLR